MASSAVLGELSSHLDKVDQDPSTPLDAELIEKCGLFTSTSYYQTEFWMETRPLFLQLAHILPKLQQDPLPLTSFIIKMTGPYRFSDIKDIEFEVGLALEAKPFHSLILSLLEKASYNSSDAEALANKPTVVRSTVRLWLCAQDTGVANQAAALLIALLRVSKNEPGPAMNQELHQYGAAPIWKRLFKDRDIFSLYFEYTTFAKLSRVPEPDLSKSEKTIAQARFLDWIMLVADMSWDVVTTCRGSDVEREVGLSEKEGLIDYACRRMVDASDDILMHMTLINFYSALITTVKSTSNHTPHDSSVSLDFLKKQGVHKEIIDFHTSDNPGLEQSFLGSRTAHYIAEYASTYPGNFENCSDLQIIRQHVHRHIRKCEPNDLNIVAAMPRITLIPKRHDTLAWSENVVLDIPISPTNQDALKTLATVFHGPPEEPTTFPVIQGSADLNPNRIMTEKALARFLLALYCSKFKNFFSEIITHAETVAMKDNALASLGLLRAIITSNWDSSFTPNQVPRQDHLFTRLQKQFPKTGVELILDPSISGAVIPYLIKPATTFSNLVGGRGDAENAAYQVVMAKFDVLKVLGERLEQQGGRQDVMAMVRRRVSEGPWGAGGNAGGRIGTLEL